MPTTVTPATDRQVSFLASLTTDRVWSADALPAQVARTVANFGAGLPVGKTEVSAAIDALLACPKVPAARPAADFLSDLPNCKYIVTGERGNAVHVEVREYRGKKYLNLLVGHPGDWSRERIALQTQKALADKIRTATYRDGDRTLTGPEAAAVRFSREYVCCAACMSPLSDETSRALGLGPVCRTRFAF